MSLLKIRKCLLSLSAVYSPYFLRGIAVIFFIGCSQILTLHAQPHGGGGSATVSPAGDVGPTSQMFDPLIVGHVDTINVASGVRQNSLTVNIPLVNYPQIGNKLKLGFSLHYETMSTKGRSSSNTIPLNAELENVENHSGGWYLVEDNNATVGAYGGSLYSIAPSPSATYENYGVRVMQPGGVAHYMAFDGTMYHSVNATGIGFVPAVGMSLEYYAPPYGTILTSDGTMITAPQYSTNLTGSICPDAAEADINCESTLRKDSDGNIITFSKTSGWVDTVGRHIPLPVSVPVTGCPSGPLPVVYALQWAFPGYNGGSYPVLICYTNADNYGGAVLNAFGLYPFTTSEIQSVVLPNGASWQFTYPTTEQNWCNALTGITYPSGATTSYTYSSGCIDAGGPGGVIVQGPQIATQTVDTNDGTGPHTWEYTASGTANSSGALTTIVTDPGNNDTEYSMTSTVPESTTGTMQPSFGSTFGSSDLVSPGSGWNNTRIDWYQGTGSSRTLLKSKILNYLSSGYYVESGSAYPGACAVGANCNNTYSNGDMSGGYPESAMNVVLKSEQTVLPGGITSEVDYAYDSAPICLLPSSGTSCAPLTFGRVTSKKEYDFGQGAKGVLLRSTSYTYQDQVNSKYLAAHILNLVQAETVYNGSGATVASSTYGYDESNGSPQGIFGNRTSENAWLNTIGGNIAAKTIYNTSGMPVQMIDPLLNITKVSYDSTGIFPYQITHPQTGSIQHVEYYTHDATTGLITSHTDENSQVTQYAYNDPLFRMTSVKSAVNTPAESWVTYSYPTLTQVNSAQDQIVKGDGMVKATVITDGFGKPLHSQITSDASGTVYTDIVYDGNGREYTASNQYRSILEPTYGNRTYIYDAIGRPTQQIDSDGVSSRTWTYVGNVVKYNDENNNQWQRAYDAAERMTSVVEPGSLVTTYSYDALDNILTVNQLGNAANGDTARIRSFSYDSLSRLLCASNPENSTAACPTSGTGAYVAGTIGYSYDSDGNEITKTSPAVNTTSGAQSIGYCYDALNRVTYKFPTGSFSCTSTSGYVASYSYDSSSISGATNVIGRLTDEKSFAGSTLVAERKPYAYDPMGRLLNEQQYTLAGEVSGTPYSPTYTYNLAGNLTSSTSGVGPTSMSTPIVLASTFDGAGRLQKVTSNWVDGTHPMSLFSAQTGQPTPCQNSLSAPYTAFGGLMNATLGGGLTLNQAYDKRMRTTCEIDTGTGATPATSGSATVTITGSEQSK